jgi:hypothetical protein
MRYTRLSACPRPCACALLNDSGSCDMCSRSNTSSTRLFPAISVPHGIGRNVARRSTGHCSYPGTHVKPKAGASVPWAASLLRHHAQPRTTRGGTTGCPGAQWPGGFCCCTAPLRRCRCGNAQGDVGWKARGGNYGFCCGVDGKGGPVSVTNDVFIVGFNDVLI